MYIAVVKNKVLPAALGSFLITAIAAHAQSVESAPTQAVEPAVTQTSTGNDTLSARGDGESVASYLARAGASNPDSLAAVVDGILQSNPTEFAQIAAFATDPGTPVEIAAQTIRGLALTSINPVTSAQQASGYALSSPENAAAIVSIARQANAPTFSGVMGEGLALAANTRRSEGNTSASLAIQTQATSANSPAELAKAFSDNFVQTAAPAAASAAAAGGGNIASGASGPLGGPSSGDASVAQSGGAGGGLGGGGFSFAEGARTTFITNTNIAPVPGPEAGSGVAVLVAAGVCYWLRRRTRVSA